MSKVALVAALLVIGACAPRGEEAPPAQDTMPAAAPAAPAPADTMARDTTSN
jgi:hypothetical protein